MGSLDKTRQKFIVALAILGIINLLLVAYLVWPGTSLKALEAREHSLEEQEKTLTKEVAPLDHIDDKLAKTRDDVKKLYEQKVPNQFSEISQHLEKLIKETGVA